MDEDEIMEEGEEEPFIPEDPDQYEDHYPEDEVDEYDDEAIDDAFEDAYQAPPEEDFEEYEEEGDDLFEGVDNPDLDYLEPEEGEEYYDDFGATDEEPDNEIDYNDETEEE